MSEQKKQTNGQSQPTSVNDAAFARACQELADLRYAERQKKERERAERVRQKNEALKTRMRKNRWTRMLGKVLISLRQSGVRYTVGRICRKLTEKQRIRLPFYNDADYAAQREAVFSRRVRFSILVPLYNTPESFLREMIASVQAQTYADWELCLADGSDAAHASVGEVVRELAKADERILYRKLEKNLGISENTNACIEMSTGDFIALFDHDDVLHPAALYEMMRAICDEGADFVYTDETTFESPDMGKILNTHYKPDFAPDNLRANNYICHFSAFDRKVLERAGMFRKQYDGSQDHDMILRLTAQAERVVHIPKILYFWRSHPQSVAMDVSSKGYAIAAGQNAVRDSLLCMGMDATVESSPAFPTIYRARYALKDTPRVSIVITVRRGASDLKRCIGSIFGVSTYSAFEIVIADGGVQDPALSDYYALLEQHPMIRVFRPGDGNSDAKIKNEAARLATGEYLLFLESDTQVITPAWIEEMLMFAQRADVAAVGAKLYYPNGILHHGGMVLGMGADEIAGTVFHRAPKAADGYMGRLFFAQNYSAVSSACMMMKSDVFWSVNGFDTAFSEAYHDVDLCLRLRKCGQLIVWTPWCEATRYCKKGTDTHPKDAELFRARWQATLAVGDPYYNPNLTLSNSDFRVRSNDENS